MNEVGEEFGVAVVRVWKRSDRFLIRVITRAGTDADDTEGEIGYASDSLDEALDHLRAFINGLDADS